MAIMKPDEIRNDAYESEQTIFNNLKSSPHPRARHWRVFHSIYVENPRNPVKPREIDFLIFIDDYCAVIYLEAKGGRYNINGIGQWCTSYGQLVSPSPPDQASSGMYALKKQYNAYFDFKSLIGAGCVVAFTDWDTYPTQRPMELTELIMCQDARDPTKLCKRLDDYAKGLLRKNLNEANYLNTLDALYDLQSELEKRYMPLEVPVDPIKITRSDLENLRQHLLRLTEEQITNLNNVELNERCVIKGAAGTGKTVLAMELARRRCEEGETVALMCSNPNLASRFKRWAKTLPSDTGGRVVAGTPATLPFEALSGNQELQNGHRQRLEDSLQLEESLKRGELNEAWERFIKETIKDLHQGNVSFDYLIVDEAQNLCEEVFLELQDALLKNGLAKGRWAMFGDFDHQNLVTGRAIDGDGTGALKSKIPYWTKGKLETNCRNTGEIAEAIARLVRIESPPRPGAYGPEFERKYFSSQEELEGMLDTLIYDWKNRGFQSNDIILLSSGTGQEFNTDRKYGDWPLIDIRDVKLAGPIRQMERVLNVSRDPSRLRYSNVYDFQGLESELVILVIPVTEDQDVIAGDVMWSREEHLNRVLYTGMSRAKTLLIVIADERYKESIEERWELYDEKE